MSGAPACERCGSTRVVVHGACQACYAREAGQPLVPLDVARMVRELPPPVPWIVEGLAVEGCLTMITGREGEGKSLLAAALAAGVALGERVAGLDCRQGTALIVDGENGEHEIHRRVHTLGLPATVAVYEADGFNLADEDSRAELGATVEVLHPTLLVLDSFRSLWPGGEENDSAAVAAALDPLRKLIRSERAAAILLHHLPKSARASYRGSTAIGASVELGFKLSRADDDPERVGRRRLDCFKCRPAPEPARRWLRLHAERGRVFIDRADPYEPEDEPERPRPVRAELAPAMLTAAAEPITWPDLARAIDRDPKDGTARRLRDDLIAAGELRALGNGRLQVPSGGGTPENGSIKPDSEGVPRCHDPIGALADGTLDDGHRDDAEIERLIAVAEHAEREAARLGLSAYDDRDGRP